MTGPPAARAAFEHLAQGELRGAAARAEALLATAWEELEGWIAVCLRSLRVDEEYREDCGQEALLRVWRSRRDYRGSQPNELRAWIHRICQREHYRILESRAREAARETLPEEDAPSPEAGPAESPSLAEGLERSEAQVALEQCLRALAGPEAGVIELLYSEAAPSEREVASMVGVSKSQVHVLRGRALASLAACLRRKGILA